MIGENESAQITPRKAILEAEQKFGGYSFCHLGRYKGRKAKKQKRKAMIGENERAQITPRIAILEAEQKFGGYSFCHLGR